MSGLQFPLSEVRVGSVNSKLVLNVKSQHERIKMRYTLAEYINL